MNRATTVSVGTLRDDVLAVVPADANIPWSV
jgi:hypothetical protein